VQIVSHELAAVTGVQVLVGIFGERESHVAHFLRSRR
jgi:hypothetical protein